VPIRYVGPSGSHCVERLQLTVTETLKGAKVIAITTARVKRPKLHKRIVVLGSATVTVAAGHHATIKISLNGRGRRLLFQHHVLKAELTLTQTGGYVILTRTITFKADRIKHNKR